MSSSNTSTDHYQLGLAAVQAGDFKTAMQELRTAVAQNPEFWEARYKLGWVLASQGFIDPAITELKIIVEHDPTHLEAHYNLGALLVQKAQLETSADDQANDQIDLSLLQEAQQAFQTVLKLQPYDQKAYAFMSIIQTAIQRYSHPPVS